DVRGQEAVILDGRIVADVIPAPQRDVIADADEGLDGVVLQDEAVVPDGVIGEEGAAAADVARQLVAAALGLPVLLRPRLIHPGVAQGDEHLVVSWGVKPDDLLEGHQRQAEEGVAREVLPVDREGRDFVIAVAGEIVMGKSGDVARPENNQLRHKAPGYSFLTSRVNSYSG